MDKGTLEEILETIQGRKVWSTNEVAAIFQITPVSVRRWVSQGTLPSFRVMNRRLIRSNTVLAVYILHFIDGHPWQVALALVRDHQVQGVEKVARAELSAEIILSDLHGTAVEIDTEADAEAVEVEV